MLQAINTWDDYREKVREFDAVLEHGKAVSSILGTELAAPSARAGYGQQIFIKLLSHCIALRGLAADPTGKTPAEVWNVPSMSALSRCAVEAHDAFEYVAGHDVTDAERAFRIQLWGLHDAARRLRTFEGMGSDAPPLDDMRSHAGRLQAELTAHEFFATLQPDLQAELRRRMAKGDPPAFHLGHRQRCALSGVNADWHNAVTMQLSQYAYTLPSALYQLFHFQPGTPEPLRLITLPLVFALPFMVRVTQAATLLMPRKPPEPPSRTARTMLLWSALAEKRPQDLGQ